MATAAPSPRFRLQQVFRLGLAEHCASHGMSDDARRAAGAILRCRTEGAGGQVRACPDGHETFIPHSCDHKLCPTCHWRQTNDALERLRDRILLTPHFHIVLKLPHAFDRLWVVHTAVMMDILFTSGRRALTKLLRDPELLGATPAIIAALQTFCGTLALDVHLHCMVAAGALTDDGDWVTAKLDYLIPTVRLREAFRDEVLTLVRKRFVGDGKDKLALPDGLSSEAFAKTLALLADERQWDGWITDRVDDPQAVIDRVAPYVLRAPISNSRITSIDDHGVEFRYGKLGWGEPPANARTMRLRHHEMVRRCLSHALPAGKHTVHSWGPYAPRSNDGRILRALRNLGHQPIVKSVRPPPLLDCGQCGQPTTRVQCVARPRLSLQQILALPAAPTRAPPRAPTQAA